ncbi:MAG TPA: hypothetical protein VKU41_17820 [Polyangiaceae bacterium]|nr:hypothetical protein [Polyangiaceae bacterium]
MASRTRPEQKPPRTAAAGSWLALLAATTLGDAAGTVRAEVKAEGLLEGTSYRLVVQTYDETDGRVPGQNARPVGSMQRAVTADELRQGVNVNLVEIRRGSDGAPGGRPVIVAWIESGQPDLEFDGRTARPRRGNVYGVVRRGAPKDVVQISLDRRA